METQANEEAANSFYGCPVEVTLEIVSGKWKCVILWWLRRLRRGEKRFSELILLIPAITRKVLTQQLRELEADSLIRREAYREKPPRVEYFLTGKGRSLRPLLELMCDWGKAQLPGFEFGIFKLAGLKVLVLTATESTAEALQNCLPQTCGAELALLSGAPSLGAMPETFAQLEPEVVIAEFGSDAEDLSRLVQWIKRWERNREKAVILIALTHNATERSQAFIQGFRITFSSPFELDELVGAISGLTGRLG